MSAQGVTLSSIYSRLNPTGDTKKDTQELKAGKKEGELGFKSRFVFKSASARQTALFKTRDEVYKVLVQDICARMGASTDEDRARAKATADKIWKTDLDQFDRPITLRAVKDLHARVQTLKVSQSHDGLVTPPDSKQAPASSAFKAVSQSAAQQITPTLIPPPLLSTVMQRTLAPTQQPSQLASSLMSSAPQVAFGLSQIETPAKPMASAQTGTRLEASPSQPHGKTKIVKNPAYQDVKSKSPSSSLPVNHPPSSGQVGGSTPAAPSAEKVIQRKYASLSPQAVANKLQDKFMDVASQKFGPNEHSRFFDHLNELANVAHTHKPELLSVTSDGQFQPDLIGAAQKLLDYNQYMTPLVALHVQLYSIEEEGLRQKFAGSDRVAYASYRQRQE